MQTAKTQPAWTSPATPGTFTLTAWTPPQEWSHRPAPRYGAFRGLELMICAKLKHFWFFQQETKIDIYTEESLPPPTSNENLALLLQRLRTTKPPSEAKQSQGPFHRGCSRGEILCHSIQERGRSKALGRPTGDRPLEKKRALG